jgi:hypothetical protein
LYVGVDYRFRVPIAREQSDPVRGEHSATGVHTMNVGPIDLSGIETRFIERHVHVGRRRLGFHD